MPFHRSKLAKCHRLGGEEVEPPARARHRVQDRPSVSVGGIVEPVAPSRSRAPATGTSTVTSSVSKPAAAARSTNVHRAVAVLPHVELEPVAPVGVGLAPRLRAWWCRPSTARTGCRPRRRPRTGALALGVHHPGEAGRGDPERQRRRVRRGRRRRVDVGDVTQDRRVKLDVLERLPSARKRQLILGGAVGVVERCTRRGALRDVRAGR